jgi:hypothetical protein
MGPGFCREAIGGSRPRKPRSQFFTTSERRDLSYEAEWRARFGNETGVPVDVPEAPWLRQVLMRRTHRRYAERPIPVPLLRLLLAAEFAVSSK